MELSTSKGMHIMMDNDKRIIFHIDVNSAYLSWSAVYRLQHGESLDLRDVPSVVGGDPISRHGIVLAKSIPAKKFNIQTGETIYSALQKCPELLIVRPCYELFMQCSNAMMDVFQEYTPKIQRFSIDECFLEFTGMENLYPDILKLAYEIKNRIKNQLGFTVSIGISNNKLLAKMASDLKKPDAVTTLFPNEIQKKMWCLPIEDLFMVGRATAPKLHRLNIHTIGDLAVYDLKLLKAQLKSHGVLIWNYANGIETSEVKKSSHIEMKGMGNSTTIAFDVEDSATAHKVILSLCETLCTRLRNSENCCSLVSVHIKGSDFYSFSHQRKLYFYTDCTNIIYATACQLFDEFWQNQPLRHIGVAVSELCSNDFCQVTLFEEKNIEKQKALDKTIDTIRMRFGSTSIVRSVFLHSSLKALNGGTADDYPVMTSIL